MKRASLLCLGFVFLHGALAWAGSLTGITLYGANSAGSMPSLAGVPTGNYWNTAGGDLTYNLYLRDAGSSWINSGNGGGVSLNIPMLPGTYTFQIFGAPGLTTQSYFGINLFFDNGTSPRISGLAPVNSGALSPNSGSQSAPLTSGAPYAFVPGAGTLIYGNVVLSGFSWYAPNVAGGAGVPAIGDYVSAYNNAPLLGINDYRGTLTINVVPEPGSFLLSGSAALLLALLLTPYNRVRRNASHSSRR